MFSAVAPYFEKRELQLQLDRDLIALFNCADCDETISIMRPMCVVAQNESICPKCGETMTSERLHILEWNAENDENSELNSRNLAELGIPAYDIVKIWDGETEQYFVLAADRSSVISTKRTVVDPPENPRTSK